MVEIIISLVTGVLGGGGVGGALKNLSMGKMGNLVSGGLGGLLTNIPGAAEMLGNFAGDETGTAAATGAIGGGALTAIIGMVKNKFLNSSGGDSPSPEA